MKKEIFMEKAFAVIFILFWLYVIYAKADDFGEFKVEMANQIFPHHMAAALPYTLPVVWLFIAGLLAFDKSRAVGLALNFTLILSFTLYVGLALFNVYDRMPCSCAGLFDLQWKGQFYFNLFVTAVAAAAVILNLTLNYRERREKVWIR